LTFSLLRPLYPSFLGIGIPCPTNNSYGQDRACKQRLLSAIDVLAA
jgi:hypothetical protein